MENENRKIEYEELLSEIKEIRAAQERMEDKVDTVGKEVKLVITNEKEGAAPVEKQVVTEMVKTYRGAQKLAFGFSVVTTGLGVLATIEGDATLAQIDFMAALGLFGISKMATYAAEDMEELLEPKEEEAVSRHR